VRSTKSCCLVKSLGEVIGSIKANAGYGYVNWQKSTQAKRA